MRVVVTGASGFIGRSLVPLLAARGHEVAGLERIATTALVDPAQAQRALAGAGAVVHLAGIAHSPGGGGPALHAANVALPLAVGRACVAAGARLLFISSVKVHGEETPDRAFHEASPLAPVDAYARAKAEAEAGLRALEGLALTVVRPPLVFGPGVKANFLWLMRAVARGWPLPFAGIANRRSLVFAENLGDAIARCLEAPQSVGRAFVVSDGAAVSTPALCRAIGEALGRPARLFRFPARGLELVPPLRRLTRSLEVDDRAIRRELGWAAPYALEEGLARTADWFRKTA